MFSTEQFTPNLLEGYKNFTLRTWRTYVVGSIFKSGIKSGSSVAKEGIHFGSEDNPPYDKIVHGNFLKPPSAFSNSGRCLTLLRDALYYEGIGCLAVVCERKQDDPDILGKDFKTEKVRKLLEERVASSFIVVCNSINKPSNERDELNTTPENFRYLIFPGQVLKTVALEKNNITCIVVEKKIQRKLFNFSGEGLELCIPDYEGEIYQLLQTINQPIWTHAVRLPTKDDLSKLPYL